MFKKSSAPTNSSLLLPPLPICTQCSIPAPRYESRYCDICTQPLPDIPDTPPRYDGLSSEQLQFSHRLWDSLDTVFNRSRQSKHSVKYYAELMNELSVIELTYSKSLQKLTTAKPYTELLSLELSSMQSAYTAVLQQISDRSELHSQYSTTLKESISVELQTIRRHMSDECKKIQQAYSDTLKQQKSAIANKAAALNKLNKLNEIHRKNDKSVSQIEYDKADEYLQECVSLEHSAENNVNRCVISSLDQLQLLELHRLHEQKQLIHSYIQLTSELYKQHHRTEFVTQRAVNDIDCIADCEEFVRRHASKETCPFLSTIPPSTKQSTQIHTTTQRYNNINRAEPNSFTHKPTVARRSSNATLVSAGPIYTSDDTNQHQMSTPSNEQPLPAQRIQPVSNPFDEDDENVDDDQTTRLHVHPEPIPANESLNTDNKLSDNAISAIAVDTALPSITRTASNASSTVSSTSTTPSHYRNHTPINESNPFGPAGPISPIQINNPSPSHNKSLSSRISGFTKDDVTGNTPPLILNTAVNSTQSNVPSPLPMTSNVTAHTPSNRSSVSSRAGTPRQSLTAQIQAAQIAQQQKVQTTTTHVPTSSTNTTTATTTTVPISMKSSTSNPFDNTDSPQQSPRVQAVQSNRHNQPVQQNKSPVIYAPAISPTNPFADDDRTTDPPLNTTSINNDKQFSTNIKPSTNNPFDPSPAQSSSPQSRESIQYQLQGNNARELARLVELQQQRERAAHDQRVQVEREQFQLKQQQRHEQEAKFKQQNDHNTHHRYPQQASPSQSMVKQQQAAILAKQQQSAPTNNRQSPSSKNKLQSHVPPTISPRPSTQHTPINHTVNKQPIVPVRTGASTNKQVSNTTNKAGDDDEISPEARAALQAAFADM